MSGPFDRGCRQLVRSNPRESGRVAECRLRAAWSHRGRPTCDACMSAMLRLRHPITRREMHWASDFEKIPKDGGTL